MAAVISVAVAATVGELIAANSLYSTIPYGFQFLFLLLGTYPAAILMKRRGRKVGFLTGAVFLFFAGILGYVSIISNNFLLLIVSHSLIGVFTAFANYYRFAVTDNLPENLKSKALSLVVAGGVVAGILGPIVAIFLQDITGFPKFSFCFLFFSFLAVINMIFILLLPKDTKYQEKEIISNHQVYKREILDTNFYLAVLSASIGYGLMNLLMIQSSLQMNHINVSFENSSLAIQWHVVAMFLPSFFTGVLISKIGHRVILFIAFLLFIISFFINIQEAGYFGIVVSLITLGVAWNFSYVGGSSLLTYSISNSANQQKWQGVCDTVIAILATCGAMLPSVLLNTIGWEKTNMIAMIVAAVPITFLMLTKFFSRKVV